MDQYIGTKIIKAEPMTHGVACAYIGRPCPTDRHNADAPGYLVEYPGDGYQTWSPAEAFEAACRKTDNMNLGLAIEAMRKGYRVTRKGWKQTSMWVWLCTPYGKWVSKEDQSYERLPYLYMTTANGEVVPWSASQIDILANDWVIVPEDGKQE